KAYGRAAVPALGVAAKSADKEVAKRAEDCLEEIATRTDWMHFIPAMNLLVKLRPAGAVPALLECYADSDPLFRDKAFEGLFKLVGPEDQQDVVRAIKDKRSHVRAGALRLSDKYKDQPKVFAPLLLEAIRDENVYVRRRAAEQLGIFREEEGVFPALLE